MGHAETPLYYKLRSAVLELPNTRNEAIECCEKIISAIKKVIAALPFTTFKELDKTRGG